MTEEFLPELPDRMRMDEPAPAPSHSSDLREAVLMLPNFVKLMYRLLRDPRLPRRPKLIAMAALGYAVSPIDVIPDFIPGIGQIDDVIVTAAALRQLVRVAGPEVVAEHWDGRGDVLYAVESALHAAGGVLPRRLQRLPAIRRLLE